MSEQSTTPFCQSCGRAMLCSPCANCHESDPRTQIERLRYEYKIADAAARAANHEVARLRAENAAMREALEKQAVTRGGSVTNHEEGRVYNWRLCNICGTHSEPHQSAHAPTCILASPHPGAELLRKVEVYECTLLKIYNHECNPDRAAQKALEAFGI